jgi:hypothetical protein
MAGLGGHPALGLHVPQKLKPNSRVMCWVLHSSKLHELNVWQHLSDFTLEIMFVNHDCSANIFFMFRWIEKFERRPHTLLAVDALGIVVVNGFLDFITGFETCFSIICLLAIGLAAWFVGRRFTVLFQF